MISFADFVIIANGVSFIVDIIVFSRKYSDHELLEKQ